MSNQQPAAAGASASVATDGADDTTREIQVLEFELGGETYCVDIGYVSEIVDRGSLTSVPNAPEFVEGVMDLRGRTTTIVDPKTLFDIEEAGARDRIVVFDDDRIGEGGTVGWMVDEVFQVRDVAADDVDESQTADDEGVHGIVKSDDRFVVWVAPDVAEDVDGMQ